MSAHALAEFTFLPHQNVVQDVAISNDGTFVVTACDDGIAYIWNDPWGPIPKFALEGHGDCVLSVAISYDDSQIATGCRDWVIRLWNATTGIKVKDVGGQGERINSLAFDNSGKHLFAGSGANGDGCEAVLWDIANSKRLKTIAHIRGVVNIAFSADGAQAATAVDSPFGTSDPQVPAQLWNLNTETVTDFGIVPIDVVLSRSAQLLVTADDTTASVWDVATKTAKVMFDAKEPVSCVNANFSKKLIVTGCVSGNVILWSLLTGKQLKSHQKHGKYVTAAAISQAADFVVTSSIDNSAIMWKI